MTWAKVDDSTLDSPAMLALERSARLLHIEALVWSCRHLTDGRISRHAMRRLTDEPDPDRAAAALVDAGIWTPVDDGWELVGFLDDQPAAKDVEKSRALTRDRQRRWRLHTQGAHEECNPKSCHAAANASRNGRDNASPNDTRDAYPVRPSRPDPPGEGGTVDERYSDGIAARPGGRSAPSQMSEQEREQARAAAAQLAAAPPTPSYARAAAKSRQALEASTS